jgi:hypothetical protein
MSTCIPSPGKRVKSFFLTRIVETAALCRMISRERLYRFQADLFGVEYLGVFEKQRVVLFQDPVTGSSFAIKEGDAVETGVVRVRERFGLL